MKSTLPTIVAVVSVYLYVFSAPGFAELSPNEVERLGADLTPVGAERAGNEAGTIPKWGGGIVTPPTGYVREGGLTDPFANENPLFVITADNMAQYENSLTPGQKAMFKTYPSTFSMPVYASHRTMAFPNTVYNTIAKYAKSALLSSGGNKLEGIGGSPVPFPIPKNGLEAIWNHSIRYRGGVLERYFTVVPVSRDGKYDVTRYKDIFANARDVRGAQEGDLWFYRQTVVSPSWKAGSSVLVHEPIDQSRIARSVWIYNNGQRRVRQAPAMSYDGPGPARTGFSTADNWGMFNGAVDRYEWELIGKQEVYIPYNSYKLVSPDLKYVDLIHSGHLNPNHTRYELHRVWVVEANLKPNQRHVYARRVYYIDEDSWWVVLADHYDGRGGLWRTAEAHLVNDYQIPTPRFACETLYDLEARRYLTLWLNNEDYVPEQYSASINRSFFEPSALLRPSTK